MRAISAKGVEAPNNGVTAFFPASFSGRTRDFGSLYECSIHSAGIYGYSSTVERPALTRKVIGSNPIAPIQGYSSVGYERTSYKR